MYTVCGVLGAVKNERSATLNMISPSRYKCPCDASGCYKQCNVMETCWVGSNADVVVSDYVPPEFAPVSTVEGITATTTATARIATATTTTLPPASPCPIEHVTVSIWGSQLCFFSVPIN